MGLILETTDFVGKYKVSQNSFSSLNSYIDKYEKKYLVELLGAELSDLFIADLVAKVPTTQKFIDIFDPISTDDGDNIKSSDGIKEMLLGFIWFEYLRDQSFKNTVSGTVTNQSEVSDKANHSDIPIYGRYNDSVGSFQTIQWFINEDLTVYPEYNGQLIGLSHWAL